MADTLVRKREPALDETFRRELECSLRAQECRGNHTPRGVSPELPQLAGYELLGEVARGGMGVVYKARHLALNRLVAVKMVLAGRWATEEQRLRFRLEAELAARVQHANIVQVHEVGDYQGQPYLVLEWVAGGTLAQYLRGKPQPPREAARLLETLASAVHAAHGHGVLHRDLKPANVLLSSSREPSASAAPALPALAGGSRLNELVPKITDFGLARPVHGGPGLTATGEAIGTPEYMSPEQAAGRREEVDVATDVHALGAILYELLTGRPPFKGAGIFETMQQVIECQPEPPRRTQPGVPRDLQTICLRCLQKVPGQRYRSAAELADDCAAFLHGEPIRARRVGEWERLWLWARRRPAVAGLLLAVAGLLVLEATVSTYFGLEARARAGDAERRRGEAEAERARANGNLYRSLVSETQALRGGRVEGYRVRAWQLLDQARALDTPDRDPDELRRQAVLCLGDLVGPEPAVLTGFAAPVRCLAVPPQSEFLALGLEDGSIELRKPGTGELLTRLGAHPAAVVALTLSGDSQQLVSADAKGAVQVWQRQPSGEWTAGRRLTVPPPADAVQLPDGKSLLAVTPNGDAVQRWDLSTGAAQGDYLVGAHGLRRVAVSPDQSLLIASYAFMPVPGGIAVWEMDTHRCVRLQPMPLNGIQGIAVSPNGKFVACACRDGLLVVGVPGYLPVASVPAAQVETVAFSPDSQLTAYGDAGQLVRIWDNVTGTPLAVLHHPGPTGAGRAVAFSADGKLFVSCAADSVRVWDMGGAGEKRAVQAHRDAAPSLAFSPDRRVLASAGRDGGVRLWDAATGEPRATLATPGGHGQVLAFSPDGRVLAAGDNAGGLHLWSMVTRAELPAPAADGGQPVFGLEFTPDGARLAAAGGDGLTVWRAVEEGGREPARFEREARAGRGRSRCVWVSPDGRLIGWVEEDGIIHLWDVSGKREVPLGCPRVLPGGTGLAFNGDGSHLFFVSQEGRVEAWDIAADREAFSLAEKDRLTVGSLALSPDGRFLAVLPAPHRAAVWDLETRKLLFALPDERSSIGTVAWAPGAARLALGLEDGGLVIWDMGRIHSELDRISLAW
jgi:WD40 repeat protein